MGLITDDNDLRRPDGLFNQCVAISRAHAGTVLARAEREALAASPAREQIRGEIEYRRWAKEPGVIIHRDGVIEIPA